MSPNIKLKMSKSQIKIAKSKLRADTKMSWATHHYDLGLVLVPGTETLVLKSDRCRSPRGLVSLSSALVTMIWGSSLVSEPTLSLENQPPSRRLNLLHLDCLWITTMFSVLLSILATIAFGESFHEALMS